MDIFEDDMELITLYHHTPRLGDKSGHSTCAYSNPAFGQMYKMNAQPTTPGVSLVYLLQSTILLNLCMETFVLILISMPELECSNTSVTKSVSLLISFNRERAYAGTGL